MKSAKQKFNKDKEDKYGRTKESYINFLGTSMFLKFTRLQISLTRLLR